MNTLYLEATEDAPKVMLDADKGHFLIKGRSFLEDCSTYYFAIVDWLRNYMTNPKSSNQLIFELEYLNASSQRMIVGILGEINKYYIMGHNFSVIWRCSDDNEIMEEFGSELSELFDLPFEQSVRATASLA